MDFPSEEKKILKFWRDNEIFEKSLKKKKGFPRFIFYEGPPYANGLPGIHHLLARAFKDAILRFKTMQGFLVERRAGWDTHGLPTEIEAEKKLKLKSKKDIEKIGIERFATECKKNVFLYKKEWEEFTERIGYWLDLKNPYITCDNEYIETLWYILKKIYEKELLYKDYKVQPYCPRCGTSLSSHEVAQGYKKIAEPAIYIKFKVKAQTLSTEQAGPSVDRQKLQIKDTSLLVWTTTPWTLPGNVAIAVNENFVYCKVKIKNEYLILAKARLNVLNADYKIVKEFKGKDLIGLKYESLYKVKSQNQRVYEVISADFVSLEEGTGLVHIAPAFGQDDMELIKSQKHEFPILITVDEEGKMKAKGYKWQNLFVKDADPKIIEDLKERNLLFREELYSHDYPFCWRCKSPLLYYAKSSWFIKITKIKKDLIKNNEKINWVPGYLKQGRFGEWLREIKDWNLSRDRYWGTPLPIWKCKECKKIVVIGSLNDLKEQKFSKNHYYLMRHGFSESNLKNIGSCDSKKYPLTPLGEKQVLATAEKLKKINIDLIFSSDVLRTKQTAEILGKELKITPRYFKELREVKYGVFEGKPVKNYQGFFKNFEERFEKKPEGSEYWWEIKKRMYNFLKKINEKYNDKNILIISHEAPITLLEGAVMGLAISEIGEYRKKSKITYAEARPLKFKIFPYDEKGVLDFHRPYIDTVKFFCPKCGNLMERVPQVIDCWFDSGAMPFAQVHWPFVQNSKLKSPELFPADFICEGIDQTRGWFYTLLAISTLLGFSEPFKNVISIGLVCDKFGKKMSKSRGNIIVPADIYEKFGADLARLYFYTLNPVGERKRVVMSELEKLYRKFFLILFNSLSFFSLYKPENFQFVGVSGGLTSANLKTSANLNVLDRWILSKINKLNKNVKENLDNFDVVQAARFLLDFVPDLSNWYIRRSRKRFQIPEQRIKAFQTFYYVLLNFSKILAPFCPFFAEKIYQELAEVRPPLTQRPPLAQSVHLEDWPKVNELLIDEKLEAKMVEVRQICTLVLAERARLGIKVRQPLQKLKIKKQKLKINEELLDLIKNEVNVKEIIFDPKIKTKIKLDTKITPKLKEEGEIREIIRQVQVMRKKSSLKPKHEILIYYFSDSAILNKTILKNKRFILFETKAKDLIFRKEIKEKEVKINQEKICLFIKKI